MSSKDKKQKLGKEVPFVSSIGLGLAGLSVAYGPAPPEEERFRLLDRAVEVGTTFWDTSDIYGDNESMLAGWFRRTGKRDRIFLASKFGLIFDRQTGTMTIDSSESYCRKACEASLQRLGIDCIDLYYAHRLNPETPVEETMRALAQLQREGKIKHIGLSGVSADTLRRACKITHVAAIQMEYSPFVLDIEGSSRILETCRELGVGVVCYSPLGRGMVSEIFLKGQIVPGPGDARLRYPRFNAENFETNSKAVEQFKLLAEQKECTLPQLALAWLLKQGKDIIPIPGTKKIRYLEENCAAKDIHLSAEDEADIRRFVENVRLEGDHWMADGSTHAFTNTVEESTG